MQRKISINNLDYITVPEEKNFSCSGCAFKETKDCNSKTDTHCITEETIWVLDTKHKAEGLILGEPKYTIQEVLKAVNKFWDFENTTLDEVIKEATKELKRVNDPQYQEYLRLKDIYEKSDNI